MIRRCCVYRSMVCRRPTRRRAIRGTRDLSIAGSYGNEMCGTIVRRERPLHGGDGRTIVIDAREQRTILRRDANVLHLRRGHAIPCRATHRNLLRRRTRPYAVRTTVISDTVAAIVALHVSIRVNRSAKATADARHVAVVTKAPITPTSAVVAVPVVAAAVIHAAVVTDRRAPVARIPHVVAAVPAPVTRRPEVPGLWRIRPRSRNPKVTVGAPRPIARNPNIIGTGYVRLLVLRNRRRRISDVHTDIEVCTDIDVRSDTNAHRHLRERSNGEAGNNGRCYNCPEYG
jgi:hypothetical protein